MSDAVDDATQGPPHGYVTGEALARVLDLSVRRIEQLAKGGVIIKNGRGNYQLIKSINGYCRWAHSKIGRGDSNHDHFVTQRARFISARADLAEMERDRFEETFLPAERVARQWETLCAIIRKRFSQIAPSAAPRIAKCTKASEVFMILTDAIHAALTELSNTDPDVILGKARRSRRAGERTHETVEQEAIDA